MLSFGFGLFVFIFGRQDLEPRLLILLLSLLSTRILAVHHTHGRALSAAEQYSVTDLPHLGFAHSHVGHMNGFCSLFSPQLLYDPETEQVRVTVLGSG